MGGLTSFVGGSTAVQSNGLKQLFLATPPMRFNVSIIKHLLFLLIGIWRSNPHIHPSDSLIQHVLIEHPGAAVFLFFDLLIFIATMTLTISQAYMVRNSHPQSKEFTLSSLGKDCITAVVVVVVWCMQIARNITTNELWNTRRFSYLRGPDGRFYNPYNHGWQRNCSDFLVNGYTRDDEVVPSSILWITSHYYRRTHLDSVYCVYGISPRLILSPRGWARVPSPYNPVKPSIFFQFHHMLLKPGKMAYSSII